MAHRLAAGTMLVWVVDPADHTLAAHGLDGCVTTYGNGESVPGAPVLPGFTLPLDRIVV